MPKPKPVTYIGEYEIIFDDLDFSWLAGDKEEIKRMYESGGSLEAMAKYRESRRAREGWMNPNSSIDRAAYEVAILVMYMCRKGELKPRKEGLT